MNFTNWLEQKSLGKIYLDLDETLICWDNNQPKLRLHVKKFIEILKKIGPVEILTHGLTAHQTALANSLNFNLPIIGRDKYYTIKKSPNNILIDDSPANNHRTVKKLKALGIGTSRLIKVKSCSGDLLNLLSRIHQLMKMNEWVEKETQGLPKKQPFKTYEKAKNLAKERCKIFQKGMKETADKYEVITDIKSKNSFKDKTIDRGKEPDKVYDVLRGAILVDSKDEIEKVVDKLKKIFLIKKIEHKDKPEFFGYYGATHVDVVICDMICEIQVMTKKLWKYKMQADEIYQKYRSVDNPPKEEVEKSRKLFKAANQ